MLDHDGTEYCLGKLIFSAKESLFKCAWPTLKQFIDFQDIEIRLDLAANSFAAIAQNRQLPDAFIRRIQGRYIRTGDLIITAAFVA
jgi:4'-phosphopantetheinyl transferase EntD